MDPKEIWFIEMDATFQNIPERANGEHYRFGSLMLISYFPDYWALIFQENTSKKF